ncbi:hypothetical protein GCM10011506_45250 [Marivirga lumbricoides]|uniref:Photosynthesis system II assembly factor Ycf48/Hcf136-like domain-containing protein n=1 Tax=Marivirga lumbricoides TaxID=1046115 RepID=A0ABQ1N8N1_9BACT|nr:hypothetical protein GCM10011506_45250 [Marivirga lumbricoides]
MMKILRTFYKLMSIMLLQVCPIQLLLAQVELVWQNPSTTTSFFYGLDVLDENTLFIAGNRDSQFLKSTNGGEDWEITGFEGEGLWAVDFVNASTGYMVTDAGNIYKSTDGGSSFTALNTGISDGRFWDVQFIDENKGWVVGRGSDFPVILYTEDGGTTWTQQEHNSFSGSGFTTVFFLNENIGWIGGYEYEIFKTTDGGNTWVKQTTTEPDQGFAFFTSMQFQDENIGYATTTIFQSSTVRKIIKTTDGGETWEPTADQTTMSYVGGLHFFDAEHGYIAGRSKIMETTNGGDSWEEIYAAPGGESLLNMVFLNDNIGYAIGSAGLILKSTDGGLNWESKRDGVVTTLRSVEFTSYTEGYAVGNAGTILSTTNGGNEWLPQSANTENTLNSLVFSDENTGWAVGNEGTILKTTDKGGNWTPQESGTSKHLRSVFFTSNERGWAVGDSLGAISATTDGGATWSFQNSNTETVLRSVYFTDNNTGWAVGDDGSIVNTVDGGSSWNIQTSESEATLNSVFFINENSGWAVGNVGEILHTIDGGENWTPQTSPVEYINDDIYLPVDLYEVQFLDDTTGFITGRQGIVLFTSDGGENWAIEQDLAGTFYGLDFLTVNSGWLVGSSGAILKYYNALNIFSFTPEEGRKGDLVTITGSAFTGAISVKFGDVDAEFTVENNTTIVATVPDGLASGAISVTTPEGTAVSATNFTTQIALGAEEKLNNSLSIYPNPSESYFTIAVNGLPIEENLHINLYNMQGRIVQKDVINLKQGEISKTYHTSSLAEGMYILNVNFGKSSIQRKILIK